MTSVSFESKNLKHYPHFDKPISIKNVKLLLSDPIRISRNKFYPFLMYREKWQPYRSASTIKPEPKNRPIRYASRRDAYIFWHYRKILSELYEKKLDLLGISHCPIAYRKIPMVGRAGGKCNIDFAKDAFTEIQTQSNCTVMALDIEGYFENLDHDKIKSIWCELINKTDLPDDHFAIFKNITKYHYVDQKDLYRRLGYLKDATVGKNTFEKYTVPYKKMPMQLCTSAEFRALVCGEDPQYPSLVRNNPYPYGIPQGAPLSDLIANFYLLHFDLEVEAYMRARGGRYMRYSDDIMLILPLKHSYEDCISFVHSSIKKHGSNLRIKDKKTCIVEYLAHGNVQKFNHILGEQGKNGLEYLGFRYDGQRTYVRDSTISRFYRKVAIAARAEGYRHVAMNPGVSRTDLLKSFNFSFFSERFTRVREERFSADYRSWTFWTYLRRAADVFSQDRQRILAQARGFKVHMKNRVEEAIDRALSKP